MLWYLISLVAFKTIDWFIFRILVDGYNGKKKNISASQEIKYL